MTRLLTPDVFGLTVLPLLGAAVALVLLTMGSQPEVARYAAVLPLAYLIGSIPWGYILLRWRRGVDIRQLGSGRTGMTNVLRIGGGKVAAAALVLDLSKGVLAVLLARMVIGATGAEVAAGLLALAGHNWSVFLRFQGGRGIATGLGGLLVMAPLPAAIGALTFIPVACVFRYVSLASLSGMLTAGGALAILSLLGRYSSAYLAYVIVAGTIIIWQHRDNIQRLLRGTERRLGQSADKP
ncbi:MAG: glycerol-3-phosphate 1-O-acyltransferase [Dehalococcoidia bacterium]|nr:glycerol-3-phosphate 1-O-acyltransferase [Dehalococcoidia bacterium]MSQ17855.1 glycerol-3-phosphate 1-O-acyltransferase [Dehalococcoidia bacterium]